MDMKISGKNIDLGDALQGHIEEKLLDSVQKYSENPVNANVTFSKDRHEFICDVTVHLSTGMHAQARGVADEVYASAESAIDRMEKQLRRYKRRLKNHHNERTTPIEAFTEASYVIEAGDDDESGSDSDELQPIIVAETEVKVQTLSVGEAVLQMELAEEEFLVFRNISHGGVNVVFRREDRNIGWIDPRRS